jgi:hypothetical protein
MAFALQLFLQVSTGTYCSHRYSEREQFILIETKSLHNVFVDRPSPVRVMAYFAETPPSAARIIQPHTP